MNETLEFLVSHGAVVIFTVVLLEQFGLPLPAAPWLLAAGALVRAGRMNWLGALGAALVGSLLADMVWFYLGRLRGRFVLTLLCSMSREPNSCLQRTQNVFVRYGMPGVVLAKFIPGLSIVAPPLAGNSGASAVRFLFFDGLGACLHSGVFMLLGYLFSHQLEQVMKALTGIGTGALGVVVSLAGLYFGYTYLQRRRMLREVRLSRISVEELHRKLETSDPPLILDLRANEELAQDPNSIQGALHLTLDQIKLHRDEIPRNREVVLYCSCPKEITSIQAALMLRKNGILRVRPLLGGLQAWRARNYPLERYTTPSSASLESSETLRTNLPRESGVGMSA